MKARCPNCGRIGKPLGELYRCDVGHLFDLDPLEGGTHSDDPTKRIEREDEIRVARRTNLTRRNTAKQGFRFGGRRDG